MSYSPQYDDYPPQNGLAISAFVVSIVSLLTCGVLSPIGLVMSVIALRRPPRGLAIAGTIISSIGMLALIGFGGLTIFTAYKAGEVATAVGKSLETESIIDMASHDIDTYASRHGDLLPSDADGAVAIRTHLDGWGNALRYRRVDDTHYQLTSAGPDGAFDNADDRTHSFPPAGFPPSTAPAAPAATAPELLPERAPAP
jgi:hypothetical protein